MKKLLLVLFTLTLGTAHAQETLNLYFENDVDTPNEASQQKLNEWIKENKNAEVFKIYGYADAKATNSYNIDLSQRRADTIKAILKANKIKYRQCKAKERAGGESLFNLEGDLNDLIGGGKNVVYQYSVNPYLWNASLDVTKTYPIKIADSQGGFIETEWINEPNNENQRCLIKIRILSKELITTGVDTKFLCENKDDDIWIPDNQEYIEEEKQITLRILEIAGKLANTSS